MLDRLRGSCIRLAVVMKKEVGRHTNLALGGSDGGVKDCTTPSAGLTATVDQIDPIKGTVTAFPALPRPAEGIGGVVTLDGSVFVGGGGICGDTTVQPYVDFLQSQQAQ